MKVEFNDLNKLKIEALKDDSMNELWACDIDFMIHFYYETCTDALLEGCIEYIKSNKFPNEDKKRMLKALLKGKEDFPINDRLLDVFTDLLEKSE